ncbi:hypothetical protein [Roseimicrobium sp. ORNL1]|uniref:hypothetical protein n=1 Tax=Roseimicrobium sp. ORNL1 TaxID=2711231 RepID=UPI0013E1152A|nr:hypothetical protein [Roseimicrobium sp. ORNL1]QIF01413.1 hypothetical protein G5S37_07730 [Roseimicrobium sp. ORNL1]
MSAPVAFKCPNCASPLKADDWDRDSGIIRCSYCRALSTVPTAGSGSAGSTQGGASPRVRPPVPLPSALTVDEGALGLTIQRRWFNWSVLFLIPFCIAWNGFMVFWYGAMFEHNAPWIFKLFPIAHVTVGVAMAYFTLATLFNRTRISVESGLIRIRHSPIPWRGNQDLDTNGVDQLYCKEKRHNGKNGPHYTYEVWAVLRDNTSCKILSTSMNEDQALFIEQKLEQALGIKDRPVAGEIVR